MFYIISNDGSYIACNGSYSEAVALMNDCYTEIEIAENEIEVVED